LTRQECCPSTSTGARTVPQMAADVWRTVYMWTCLSPGACSHLSAELLSKSQIFHRLGQTFASWRMYNIYALHTSSRFRIQKPGHPTSSMSSVPNHAESPIESSSSAVGTNRSRRVTTCRQKRCHRDAFDLLQDAMHERPEDHRLCILNSSLYRTLKA
jgi:hypothetical protein